ncbi:MAG: aspartate dehydrogenase [Lachnospiraceae bacterium]|nr:aspartate dehydrogenase [Lachnospiraceae bacterium]
MLFFRKQKTERKEYDRQKQKPLIRCSICNGEQVAGFKDLQSGAFTEIMLIRSSADLRSFMDMYGIEEEPEKVY